MLGWKYEIFYKEDHSGTADSDAYRHHCFARIGRLNDQS